MQHKTSRNFYNRLAKIEVKKYMNLEISCFSYEVLQSQITRILYRNNYFLLSEYNFVILNS